MDYQTNVPLNQPPIEPKKSWFYPYRWMLGILSILILVIVGIFGFKYLGQKQQEAKLEEQAQTLTTYVDPKFGYEFQYPSIYTPNQTVDNSCCYTKEFENLASGTDFSVSISYNTYGKPKTVDEKIAANNGQQSIFGQINAKKITIAGIPAARFDYGVATGDAAKIIGTSNVGGIQVSWDKDDLEYSLELRSPAKIPKVASDAIDTIIRTFKYNPQPLTECGTYRSDILGFEFTCPEKWFTNTKIAHYNSSIDFSSDVSYFTNTQGMGDFFGGNLTLMVQSNADPILSLKDWVTKNMGCASDKCTDTNVSIAGAEAIRRTEIDPISNEPSLTVIINKPVYSNMRDSITNVMVFSTVGDTNIKNLDTLLGTLKLFDAKD